MTPPKTSSGSKESAPRSGTSDLFLAALLGARYFQLAESADQGDTLWLVVLTFIYASIQFWIRWRNGESLRRPDRVDYAVMALVGAHVVSAAAIVMTEGHKRAALNMAWEWLASLGIWFELRRVFQAGRGASLLRMLVALGVCLAGYGIWQNQVWFKQNAALVNEHEELRDRPHLTDIERQRVQEIARQLGSDFQSATGSSRKMLLDRFRFSTEPMGCFGLANTLAGVLIVSLWLARAAGLRLRGHLWRLAPVITVMVFAVLGLCLVMTKSRTAVLGLLISAGLYWFVSRTGKWVRQGAIAALTVIVSGAVLLGLALMTGLIDRQVISEAPKSLKYRLEYWSATSQMIAEHPWLGAGPGNFRAHYLHHKLKGASEEILDPHNLLFDVWANGGVVAWAGLVALIVWGIRMGWRAVLYEINTPQMNSPDSVPVRWSESIQLALAGPSLVIGEQLLFGGGIEPRMLGFLIACPFVAGWLVSLAGPVRTGAIWAGWLALSLHLCGAGGIAMPVIFQLWSVLLVALVTAPQMVVHDHDDTAISYRVWQSPPLMIGGAIVCGVLAVVCLRTGLLPNALCRAEIMLATETMASTGNRGTAERQLIAATENDPLSPEPWGLLLSLHGSGEPSELNAAVEAGREAIARNPESPVYYEALGDVLAAAQPAEEANQRHAIEAYREAAKRYPNSVRIRTSLAILLSQTGHQKAAAEQAKLAIELDDLNRAAVHWDKELPKEKRQTLDEIAAGVTSPRQ